MSQILAKKDSLVSDVYPMHSSKQFVTPNTLEDNIRFRGAMSKLISDFAQVEISNKGKDILRMYHSSSWHSEPYHQNQDPSEWLQKNQSMDQYYPQQVWSTCQLLATLHELCMLHPIPYISCKPLKGQIPLTTLNGGTPDISILIMYTFYQSVYYASPNQSFPSTSEEKHAFGVGFGEHVGDAITQQLLDSSSK